MRLRCLLYMQGQTELIMKSAIAAKHGQHIVFDIGHCTVIRRDGGGLLLKEFAGRKTIVSLTNYFFLSLLLQKKKFSMRMLIEILLLEWRFLIRSNIQARNSHVLSKYLFNGQLVFCIQKSLPVLSKKYEFCLRRQLVKVLIMKKYISLFR